MTTMFTRQPPGTTQETQPKPDQDFLLGALKSSSKLKFTYRAPLANSTRLFPSDFTALTKQLDEWQSFAHHNLLRRVLANQHAYNYGSSAGATLPGINTILYGYIVRDKVTQVSHAMHGDLHCAAASGQKAFPNASIYGTHSIALAVHVRPRT